MTTDILLAGLVRLNLIAAAAIVLVLALRPVMLRWFGPRLAYGGWLLVPLAIASGLLPAREVIEYIEPAALIGVADEPLFIADSPDPASETGVRHDTRTFVMSGHIDTILLVVWLAGFAALLGRSVIRSRHIARDPAIGPALVGVFRPRIILPDDFHKRFSAGERDLILAHETRHRRSGHHRVNALVEVARCLCWFNPLAHLAARRFRQDQELACDAAVMSAHPGQRREYAQALLKAQVSPGYLPLVCTWTSRSARHLEERITQLHRPPQHVSRIIFGVFLVAIASLTTGYVVWAQQPERRVTQVTRPTPAWTPSSEAPAGTLSHDLEARRHDFFLELAQAGDIDLVFFGTTDTEMWWWDRGRAVWDRAFESIAAANFGSQGTQPRSLLWRMRNGELDGFDAKLIVLQPWGRPDLDIPVAERAAYVRDFLPLIAEVRGRQPDARLLLMAPLPRMGSLDAWRRQAVEYDAMMASLADNDTVFYANLGEGFFNPDGSFKTETWSGGRQAPGFEIWAEALQPWLDRFLD